MNTLKNARRAAQTKPPGIFRRLCVMAAAAGMTMAVQSSAWAVCSDGGILPATTGFSVNSADPRIVNWSPGVFTGTAGSFFIPDTSTNEFNDPAQPVTGGGHNWTFDQGSTTCKTVDEGAAGAVPTAWGIPVNNGSNCILLPIIQGGVFKNLGDIPYQGDVITPTCNPSLLVSSANPTGAGNTRLNQLGCAISQFHNGGPDAVTGLPPATTPQTATSYMFVAGIKGGLFAVPLDNADPSIVGGESGKTVGGFIYYSAIPEGQKLTNAAVSPDGMFAIATSNKRATYVYGCLNPLGYPGEPNQPIDPNYFLPTGGEVACMQVGNNALQVDLTTAFGPDNQPYFGGQRVVTSFNSPPGGPAANAWPQCIFNGFGFSNPAPTTLMGKLQAVFAAKSANHCGNAVGNSSFTGAFITQPQTLIKHGAYMYTGPVGGTVVQFKLSHDTLGRTTYRSRQYANGLSLTTGLGVADDLQSLMMMTDPSAIGAAGREIIWKVPLCEDMPNF